MRALGIKGHPAGTTTSASKQAVRGISRCWQTERSFTYANESPRANDSPPWENRLFYPFCGTEMKVLAFITVFATARTIRRSLKPPAQEPEPLAHGPPHEIELLNQIA